METYTHTETNPLSASERDERQFTIMELFVENCYTFNVQQFLTFY